MQMPPSPHAHTLPSATIVLLVDDEPSILRAMSEGLLALDSSVTVLTAGSAEEALQIVGRTRVSVVVTDLSMPGKDGFWLLLELQQRLPDQPRIVCSSALTPAACYRIERAGVLECLHKPVSPRVLYQKITQLVGQTQSQPLSFIRGISLASILQLLELEQKSCTMTVQSGSESGKIFVVHGAVHDAQTGSLRGIEASFRMLGWRETQISIEDSCDPTIPNVIQQSVTSLVMEAAHQLDEMANLAEAQQITDAYPEISGTAPEHPGEEATPEIVQAVVDLDPDAYPDLTAEDRGEMAKLIARAPALSATDIFEFGYEALKRGRLELAREMLRLALQKEPDNRLIQHNLRVVEKKIAASGAGSLAGGTR